MEVKNPDAAGIDISSRDHYVAVPLGRDTESVRKFGSFTEDLYVLVGWLKQCRIKTVAMESTGIYWYHLFTILQEEGFEVYLVNARHIKNVPGRKSDVSDCQWIQKLHSFGLLNNSFQPDELTRELRNYVRQRKTIIEGLSSSSNRMIKAMEMMNIKLNNVLREVTGKSGKTIIEAILSGERNAAKLAKLADPRVKASKKIIEKSLNAHYRDEQLFNLKQAYAHYGFLKSQLEECDQMSRKAIERFDRENPNEPIKPSKETKVKKQKNQPNFRVKTYLKAIHGVDVLEISRIKETIGLTVLSETGPELKKKFPTEKQFLSWLNLVPDNKVSGDKLISSKMKRKKNRAGQAFREAANALWNAKSPLGEFLRKKKAKKGSRQAIVATAKKLAAIYYKMVTHKVAFSTEQLRKDSHKNLLKTYQMTLKKVDRLQKQLIIIPMIEN